MEVVKGRDIVRTFIVIIIECGVNYILSTLSRRCGGIDINNLVFEEKARGNMSEKRAIVPDVNAYTISVCRC